MEVLHGRYRLVERLGAGGMSVVWRGHDQILGRQVAVKMLNSGHSAFRHNIRVEAQAAARLNHPHIASVYDYGEVPSPAGPVPYVVMELVDGQPLSARVADGAALPWREAVRAGAEVAAALASAHARGVVHRDVTPDNVMLTPNGAKVVDFGISALAGQRNHSPDGTLLGTPAYLAPERLADGEVAPATDVYALGLLLYRCLTGRLPWQASTTTGMLRAHLYADPTPMPEVADLPDEVTEVVHRCLAKDPADRPCSVEVARALAGAIGATAVLPGLPQIGAAASADRLETTILPSNFTTDPLTAAPPPRRADWRRQAAAVAGALAGLAAVGWFTGATDPDPVKADTPAPAAVSATPCQVRYAVTGRSGTQIQLRVTNASTRPVSLATLDGPLAPGAAAPLRTAEGGAIPIAKDTDGTACTALLDGPTAPAGTTRGPVIIQSGERQDNRGSGSSGSGGGKDRVRDEDQDRDRDKYWDQDRDKDWLKGWYKEHRGGGHHGDDD